MFDIEKNATETLRIERSDFKGHDLVNIRVWVEKQGPGKGTPTMVPTRKGVTFQRELLPQVIDALGKLLDGAEKTPDTI